MSMEVGYIPGVTENQTWDESKELVITLGGEILARGTINGFHLEMGTQTCTDPDCIGHLMPDEFLWFTAKVAPPQEKSL